MKKITVIEFSPSKLWRWFQTSSRKIDNEFPQEKGNFPYLQSTQNMWRDRKIGTEFLTKLVRGDFSATEITVKTH